MKFIAVSSNGNREENLPNLFAMLKNRKNKWALSSANMNPNIVSIGM